MTIPKVNNISMPSVDAQSPIKNAFKFNEMWQFAIRVKVAVMHTN